MKRRTFIQQSFGLAAAALLPKPAFLSMQPDPVIGHGSFTYKTDLKWGAADPTKYPVNDCHEMVMDKQGRIYLTTNDTHNNVLIYNKDGKIINAWGTEYPGAHGLTLHDENGTEVLYITDYARHEVIKTTTDGKVIRVFGYPADSGKYTSKDQFSPTETTVGPDGDLYIADGYGLDYIIRYDQDGHLKQIFAGKGDQPANLNNAHGIALDTRNPGQPVLLITSRADNTLKRYSLSGAHLESIPLPGAYICRPVVHGDHVYFAVLISHLPWDSQSGFVLILDKDNRVVSCPGGSLPHYGANKVPDEPIYQTVRVFKHPHDVLVDGDGNLYVSQWNSGKVYPARLLKV